jgi:hypothetical protein
MPLLAAVLVVGAALRVGAVQHHCFIEQDEGRYLDNAVNILNGRGLATHYTSTVIRQAPPLHADDTSSPLYPYLLAGTFYLTGADPRAAQMWSLATGCLVIVLTFLLGRRLFDDRTALLASVMVALNPDNVILSSWSMPEMLYGAMLIGILLLADGDRGFGMDPARAAALGAACGVLYLTRADGLAVAAAMILVALLIRRPASATLMAICFLAVISPWLIRNARVSGSPAWSAMNPVGTAGLAADLLHRAVRAARCLVWGDTGAYNLLCALFPFALLALWRQRRLTPGHLSILVTALFLFGLPTWTAAPSRHLAPVRPLIYLCVIGAAMHLAPALVWRRNLRRARQPGRAGEPSPGHSMTTEPVRRQAAMALATLVAVIALVSTRPLHEFMAADDTGRDALAREAARWIAGQTPGDSVLMEGAGIHQYCFLFDRAVVSVPPGGLDDLVRAASDFGAHYLVVSPDLPRSHPALRQYFHETGEGILGVGLPPGFTEVFAGAGRRIVIWKLPQEVT